MPDQAPPRVASARPASAPARFLATLATVLAVTGCASVPSEESGPQGPQPRSDARAAFVDFAPAMRCMDALMAEHGVRDVSVLVEDLADPDGRVGAGSRDLLVSVVAELAQRSGAVRLVASRKDWGNTASHLRELEREAPLAVVPQYALRGALSMPAGQQRMALTMTVLDTSSMTVVPGAGSRSAAVLLPDGHAEVRKAGLVFTIAAPDPTQALRPLAQLAAIEVFGRLVRVPYWRCVGATPEDAAIAAEIQDWYDAMATDPPRLIAYFQRQMRVRGAYEGPLDGRVNAAFMDAVSGYRGALGLSAEPQLSLDFFERYLAADHAAVAEALPPVAVHSGPPEAGAPAAEAVPTPDPTAEPSPTPVAEPSPAPAPMADTSPGPAPSLAVPALQRAAGVPAAAPLALRVVASNGARPFLAGEQLRFYVRPSRAAHVYCFLQDDNQQVLRVFPNRFQPDSRVTTGGLHLPGEVPFQIRMNDRRQQESVACFGTERDVLSELPDRLGHGDLTPLPVGGLGELERAFAQIAGPGLARQRLVMRPL